LTDDQKVKKHFEKSIAEFDLLYTEKKNWIRRFIDKRFRYDNYERYDLTLKECKDISGKRLLDIGCGAGRYCIDLAKKGAESVVGVDLAETAVQMACSLADSNGVSDSCSFISGNFMERQFDHKFHICLAIGVMDYVSNPMPLISKMRQVTTDKLIMSFPSKSTYRMAIRKSRYWIKNCPLYFYNSDDIKKIMAESEINDYSITKLSGSDNSGDYFVVVRLQTENDFSNH
jgi:2-polyprenyl-3-methyl-5-hydroxy-6-metoxy-1,4-benzoquinol methylase